MNTARFAGIAWLSVFTVAGCGSTDDPPGMGVDPSMLGSMSSGTGGTVPPGSAPMQTTPGIAQPGVVTTATTATTPSVGATTMATTSATTTTPASTTPPSAGTDMVMGEPVPSDGTGTMEAEMPVAPAPEIIDDFEDGDNVLMSLEGRAGHWNAYNDGTGQQMPAPGSALTPEAGGANGSAKALHTSGSGFMDWGAGLQVDLNNTGSGASAREPFDASAYTGVSFYVRGTGELRVEFVTRETSEASQGGTCAENCYDSHGSKVLALTDEWTLVTLHFADLAQEGWGTPADFSASSLLGFNFKALIGEEAGASFDLWLDELKFSTSEPGSTPTTPGEPEPEPEPDPGPMSEPGMCKADLGNYNGNGSVTMYWFDQGSSEVNCSYEITNRNPDKVAHVVTGDGRFFGAMNTADYNTAAMCGACVEVTRDGSRKVTVTIVDQCPVGSNPKCQRGHIDLSRDAFHEIGGDNEGHLGTGNGGTTGSISWKYVPCPVTGNVIFKWKKGKDGDQYWDELLVENTPFAITSVEIDGEAATRKEYNYWEPPEGTISASKDSYRVRVTDVNGSVIEASIERPTTEVDSGVQLSCQ